MDNNQNTVQEIKGIVEKYYKPEVIPLAETKGLIVVPEGLRVYTAEEYVDRAREKPKALRGSTSLHTCGSFIEFVNRYKNDTSAIFYSKDEQSVTCIFDCATKEQTSFEKHRASYSFPFSKELKAWAKNNNSNMGQLEFATFIESQVLDLSEPPTPEDEGKSLKEIRLRCGGQYANVSKMVDLSRGISVRSDERATIKQNLDTGEATISFQSEHTDLGGKPIKVPNMFIIVIPVLEGGKAYQLPCRLRYRLKDGVVIWKYEVINLDSAIDLAIDEELQRMEKETQLPIFYGDLPQGR